MTARLLLERLPAETEALRHLRFVGSFDDIPTGDLGLAWRWLCAARYSLNESIRNVERELARRPPVEG